jgi:short subunit dehydrogenase-like uncharacterized protein
MPTRPFQITVWGANGFVGKLVCEHVAKSYQVREKAMHATTRARGAWL